MYLDNLKNTIMYKIKKEFKDIKVTDTPINNNKETKEYKFPTLLFKSYVDDNYDKINVIDYDVYNKYLKEHILNNINNTNYVYYNDFKYKILNYENGVLYLEKPIKNLHEYNDILYLNDAKEINEDFIFVSSPYTYSDRLNYNTLIVYRRFNFDIFIYEDLHNDKIEFYTSKLHNLFSRDFFVLDNDYKETKTMAYIQTNLNFDISEYNITNKILRGSILIKVYKN